jgi:hypothetical protein
VALRTVTRTFITRFPARTVPVQPSPVRVASVTSPRSINDFPSLNACHDAAARTVASLHSLIPSTQPALSTPRNPSHHLPTTIQPFCNLLAFVIRRPHVPRVRGTPWIRTLLLSLCLIAAGFGLSRLIAQRPTTEPLPTAPSIDRPTPENRPITRFELRLSAAAAEVTVDTGNGPTQLAPAPPITGQLSFDPKNPTLALTVRWRDNPAPGEYRFAKLILMPAGRETITHTFESSGHIDDFIELPIP